MSLTSYWTGDGEGAVQDGIQDWLPVDLENIPLHTYVPAGKEMVPVKSEQDRMSSDEE